MKSRFKTWNQIWCGKDADHGRTAESSTRDSAAENTTKKVEKSKKIKFLKPRYD